MSASWRPGTGHTQSTNALDRFRAEHDPFGRVQTVAKNLLHAEESEAQRHEASSCRAEQRIRLLNQQEKEVSTELSALVKTNEALGESMELQCSLPVVGLLTAARVLNETNDAELIPNKRQLSS